MGLVLASSLISDLVSQCNGPSALSHQERRHQQNEALGRVADMD